MSPTTPSNPQPDANPTPRHLMAKEAKGVMKEAKQVMRRKVLLGNAMSMTEWNNEIAEEAFLEAAARIAPALTASQIPDRDESCKKLSIITTTVHGVFKKEAWRVLLNHYSLTLEAGDTRSLTNHREAVIAPLLVDHGYLFMNSTIMSPVNHPAVVDTIYHSIWSTLLHEVLDFNKLNDLDDLFSIRGAAVHNTLLEFQEGMYKPVQFSPTSSSGREYKAIQAHNTIVCNTPALYSASHLIKQDMIA
ncbi:hypothetical protein BDR05DRAFT_1006561 [Suillus weaverae]|nr:hypothetical protein BDR05DRAFT_1006561 [Suillus weaverae]